MLARMTRAFTEHPASVGESYGEHLVHAGGFAGRLLFAGVVCLVHAILPFLFVKTGSNMIRNLFSRMVTNRVKQTSNWQAPPDWVI